MRETMNDDHLELFSVGHASLSSVETDFFEAEIDLSDDIMWSGWLSRGCVEIGKSEDIGRTRYASMCLIQMCYFVGRYDHYGEYTLDGVSHDIVEHLERPDAKYTRYCAWESCSMQCEHRQIRVKEWRI